VERGGEIIRMTRKRKKLSEKMREVIPKVEGGKGGLSVGRQLSLGMEIEKKGKWYTKW